MRYFLLNHLNLLAADAHAQTKFSTRLLCRLCRIRVNLLRPHYLLEEHTEHRDVRIIAGNPIMMCAFRIVFIVLLATAVFVQRCTAIKISTLNASFLLGETAQMTVFSPVSGAHTYWAFVNNTQWGSFCTIVSPADSCQIQLPIPRRSGDGPSRFARQDVVPKPKLSISRGQADAHSRQK